MRILREPYGPPDLSRILREPIGFPPRIFRELKIEKAFLASKNTVTELIQMMGLLADLKKKFEVTTTDSKHKKKIVLGIFRTEDFNIKGPNDIWAGETLTTSHDFSSVKC